MRSAWLLAIAACAPPPAPPPLSNAPAQPAPVLGKLVAKQTVHVAVDGDTIYVDGAGPLLISHDRGRTFRPWSESATLCVSHFVAAGSTIYVLAARCTETDVQTDPDKLYRSTDGGTTWINLGDTPAILRGVDRRHPTVLYADDTCGREYASCRSDDGGATWHPIIAPPSSPQYATQFSTLFVADDGGLLYVPVRDHGFELDRSDDRGATWKPIVTAPDPPLNSVSAVVDGAILGEDLGACRIVRSAGGQPFAPVFTPKGCEPGSYLGGHGRLACGVFADDQVVVSNDAGATWRDLGLPHAAFDHVEAGPDGLRHVKSNARYTCLAFPDRILIAAADGLYAIAPPW